MSAEHSSTYLKEWWSGLNEAQASDLKAKYNSSSWVSDPNGGNLPEKLKKFHLEKLFQLAQ
jgi:hypothetical protein